MTNEEKITDTPPDLTAPEVRAESDVHHKLGQVSIKEDAASISLDIEVNALSPAVYAPAEASPYIGTAKRGPNIHDSPDQAAQAIGYVAGIFPGSNFSYLGSGRYGVVLADTTGKAFKVYRSALHYSKYEREAGALRLLSEAGLAPKPRLFVDAGEEYRLDIKHHDYTENGFEDIQIPRQNSGRALPVLVMDKIDVAPLESAEPTKLADGFCKMAELFLEENIYSWDGEVVVNRQSGDIIMLDVGELFQKPFDASTATSEAKMEHDKEILRGITLDFGLTSIEGKIKSVYAQGGLDAVRALIMEL